MNITHFGTLYIVATPLGNLNDMSKRAVDVLQSVDLIAAEDTRHSLPLLQFFSIHTQTLSFHDHNEKTRTVQLLNYLKEGKSVALISDAGTPLISDPGYRLVEAVRSFGITVVPIPGPCAAITALSASGLPTDRFVFEGFLPKKGKSRQDRLAFLSEETRTLIFYEAPHRLAVFLEELSLVFGELRQAVIARELTKRYETILSGSLQTLLDRVHKDPNQTRGEMVVLVEGAEENRKKPEESAILQLLIDALPLKQAVDLAAKITGGQKNALYKLALQLKKPIEN